MFKKPSNLDLDNLEVGQRLRINHTECEAGEDTRRRLYLERPPSNPSVVVYYCHNCSEGGAWNSTSDSFRYQKHTAPARIFEKTEVIEEPDLVFVIPDMPSYAQGHVVKSCLPSTWLEKYRLGYDPQSDRFYTPQYDVVDGSCNVGSLYGYQLRLLHGTGPKYLTVQMPEFQGYTLLKNGDPRGQLAVIVEDLISGIHVHQYMVDQGIDGVVAVNYGTKINTHMLWSLQKCSKVVVWLDNDSQYVINQAKQIAKTVALYGVLGVPQLEHTDPKYCGAHIIGEVLHG